MTEALKAGWKKFIADSSPYAFMSRQLLFSGNKGGTQMHRHLGHRHSIFCILPPHVLRDIAQTGTEEQRQAALDTLAADSTFRTLRAIRQAAPVATASPATVSLSAVVETSEEKQLQRTIFDCHNTRTLPGEPTR